ncbi:unnamed protein product [Diatraea saccharalis]|uniref:Uncharacterized protein n=1 Tax=Diatraea saccharalis TaxID=40085 RepID=A0A9N9WKL6_9NEOP|nr:unnamed protein product [Diatraea saccharalis]
MKPFFTPAHTQPQQHFKFGITQNSNAHNLNQQNNHQPKFKFGIPPSRQVRLPIAQPQQSGYKPHLPQQPFGYKPPFTQGQQQFGYRPQFSQGQPQFGYKPQLNQGQTQFGYRPQLNQNQPQLGYKPNFGQTQQQLGYRPQQRLPPQLSTDVSMRTAPPAKPQFHINELYNLNEPEYVESNCKNEECEIDYNYNNEYVEYADDLEPHYIDDQDNSEPPVQSIENFHISACNQNLR